MEHMYAVLAIPLLLLAQEQKRLEFEVASIKPAAPDARGRSIRPSPGGRVNIGNMPLKEMITLAWRIQPYQIVGGPPWFDSVGFDISAKAADTLKDGELPLMLRSLLEDRFQLAHHTETRDLPIYALVLARKDGKLGPGLTETKEGSCTTPDPSAPPSPPQPGSPLPRNCGQMQTGLRNLRAVGVQISLLVPMLSRLLGVPWSIRPAWQAGTTLTSNGLSTTRSCCNYPPTRRSRSQTGRGLPFLPRCRSSWG
jgi:uncharacterized protein (TIGR03435 family)